jgi:NodT family efflux transporter outer membrane factor (OMF) lipoprotein
MVIVVVLLLAWGCSIPKLSVEANNYTPPAFSSVKDSSQIIDSTNTADIIWSDYFNDKNLVALIDTAISNNQELNILLQRINMSKTEVQARKGEYLPTLGGAIGGGVEKAGRYTRRGALEEDLEIAPDKAFPEPYPDLFVGVQASWEVDIWRKLRNSKDAAIQEYLSSIEGKNFVITELVSEVSRNYYTLLALDNQLKYIERNLNLQKNVLRILRQEKEAAKVTQLAVNRFEAQVLNTKNLQYEVKQEIVEVENHINFLMGRFPEPIERSSQEFTSITFDTIMTGVPSQLLINRPDIKKAEYELAAAKLDVKVARANFYPSLSIDAEAGIRAFNPTFLFDPQSLAYSLAGDIVAPLINRKAIKAEYNRANAKQIAVIIEYEQSILNAFIEVKNEVSRIQNYSESYTTKAEEVRILNKSVQISNSLYASARADYMEVLMTQREALESQRELIDIKLEQLISKVELYQALGGGWR